MQYVQGPVVGLAFVPGCVPTYNKKKVAHLSMDTGGIYLYRPVRQKQMYT